MVEGANVYKAYTSESLGGSFFHAITIGTVVVLPGGRRMVSTHNGETLHALTPEWEATEAAAKRTVHRSMLRWIGKQQAMADELAAEILHDDLTTVEVQNGVA